jgi:hypothetical protein
MIGQIAGHFNGRYWIVRLFRKTLLAHRVVYALHNKVEWDDMDMIDHIDRNTRNNHPSNLRLSTNQTNQLNRIGLGKSSSMKGVCYIKHGKRQKRWQANCYKDGEKFFLGNFHTEIEAAYAYNQKMLELFPEFTEFLLLNNIKEIV